MSYKFFVKFISVLSLAGLLAGCAQVFEEVPKETPTPIGTTTPEGTSTVEAVGTTTETVEVGTSTTPAEEASGTSTGTEVK